MDETGLPEETWHEFVTLQSEESFARRNQSNIAVDQDAVDHEHILPLKEERANAKRVLTNVVKEVSAAFVCQSSEKGEYLAQFEARLKALFSSFEQACELLKLRSMKKMILMNAVHNSRKQRHVLSALNEGIIC